ncbi:ATP-binding protein [Pseudoclavibacter soli]|uniref:ATP-binding protein n=1 Tax=Pseudoclavibacter soli TaxID=452623 RepID=UPI0004033BDB|nr:ATP-binding protein [Pseudoclavibacter soli]
MARARVLAQLPTAPDWPTTVRSRRSNGAVQGLDGSVWLYRRVPLGPVRDAKTVQDALNVQRVIDNAFSACANLASIHGSKRAMNQNGYRSFHLISVTIPRFFRPPTSHKIAEYLRDSHGDVVVHDKVVLFGVQLRSSIANVGIKAAVESVVDTFIQGGVPMSDFDLDLQKVDAALERAGLLPMRDQDFRAVNGWWNYGSAPDIPLVTYSDHIRFFVDRKAERAAELMGFDKPELWDDIEGQRPITFAAVSDFELPYVDESQTWVRWAQQLQDMGCPMLSIRGLVEPAKITRSEVRGQIVQFRGDIRDRHDAGKLSKDELDTKLAELESIDQAYSAAGAAPPTLVKTSIIAAVPGQVSDLEDLSMDSVFHLAAMEDRQDIAWMEAQLASSVRANPNLEDLPSTTVAYSGIVNESRVGDRTGILMGFTETDSQPVWLSPTAVSDEDVPPIFLVAAGSGSGKTMMLLNMADQFSRMGVPNIIVDPKYGSDHSAAVLASGGQVISMDDLKSSDGALDPLRFSVENPQEQIDTAAATILQIAPWSEPPERFERELNSAISYGVRQRGAKCTGEALIYAYKDGKASRALVEPIFQLKQDSSLFSAFFGIHPESAPLGAFAGTTLLKLGRTRLSLPTNMAARHSLNERLGVATVKMMFVGAMMSLTNRDGVLLQDESWLLTNTSPEAAEEAGRLCRSMRVLPVFFSQDITGAIRAGLGPHVSRVAIGHIREKEQAVAALQVARIEPTPELVNRIMEKPTRGGSDGVQVVNWSSMASLRRQNPDGTSEVVRGSVFIITDLAGRSVPTLIQLSAEFLARASTNRQDIMAREQLVDVPEAS